MSDIFAGFGGHEGPDMDGDIFAPGALKGMIESARGMPVDMNFEPDKRVGMVKDAWYDNGLHFRVALDDTSPYANAVRRLANSGTIASSLGCLYKDVGARYSRWKRVVRWVAQRSPKPMRSAILRRIKPDGLDVYRVQPIEWSVIPVAKGDWLPGPRPRRTKYGAHEIVVDE